jgi:hypothetical protein
MNGKAIALVAGIVLVLGVVCAAGAGAAPGAGPVLFPHKPHAENQVACVDCHGDVNTAKGLQRVLPAKAKCAECHDVKSDCGTCHADAKKPKGYGKAWRRTNFVHAQHVEAEVLADCPSCHGTMESGASATLSHASCVECHKDDVDGLLCAKCHRDFNAVGLKALTSFSHKANFVTEHKEFARKSGATCAQCHQESFCLDCHNPREEVKPSVKYPEKVFRNFVHRGDWRTVHAMEAKADGATCLSCHKPGECKTCHERRGLDQEGDYRVRRHPNGWVSSHGTEARRNVLVCASCHDRGKESVCVKCHAGGGFNPHPADWKQRLHNRNAIQHKDKRTCLTCHKERELCSKCHD